MPTIEYRRAWCKKCEDWKLHSQQYPNWEDWFCNDCESLHVAVKLSAIPEEKLVEQRERYKEYRKKGTSEILGSFYLFSGNMRLFDETGSDTIITEADAGQRAIDEQKRKKEIDEKMARHEKCQKEKTEIEKYKHLGRNDECLCGSSLKYKKCCLTRIQELWQRL